MLYGLRGNTASPSLCLLSGRVGQQTINKTNIFEVACCPIILFREDFMMHGFGNFGFGMGLGWIFMIIFWGMVIYLVVAFFNKNRRDSTDSDKKETTEEILKKRLARGEISVEEYEHLKKRLNE